MPEQKTISPAFKIKSAKIIYITVYNYINDNSKGKNKMKFNSMEYLNSFGKSGKPIKNLLRIEKLLKLLGNPQNELRFIHIAGTNGKGSVLEEISACLVRNKIKTGQLTSPFIRRYNDRIRINNVEIPDNKIDEYCERISKLDITKDCSQFEITFAIALLWFKDEKCEVCVLETGIGGLLDATNIIESPLVSVITSISLDHTAILGDTIEKITMQKAGIIKNNSACVTDAFNKSESLEIIKRETEKKKSECIIPDILKSELVKTNFDGTEFIYKGKKYKTAMPGVHQMHNSMIFIEVMEYLKRKKYFEISEESIEYAVSNTKIEGRIQLLRKNPPLYLDGGHNEDGAAVLCDFVEKSNLKKPIVAILGMIKTKDYKTVCREFDGVFDNVICTDGFVYNAVPKEELAEYFVRSKTEVMNLKEAYEKVREQKYGTAIICGSLYLVSRVLEDFYKN